MFFSRPPNVSAEQGCRKHGSLSACALHRSCCTYHRHSSGGEPRCTAGRNDKADVQASLRSGQLVHMEGPDTIADGLRVRRGSGPSI